MVYYLGLKRFLQAIHQMLQNHRQFEAFQQHLDNSGLPQVHQYLAHFEMLQQAQENLHDKIIQLKQQLVCLEILF